MCVKWGRGLYVCEVGGGGTRAPTSALHVYICISLCVCMCMSTLTIHDYNNKWQGVGLELIKVLQTSTVCYGKKLTVYYHTQLTIYYHTKMTIYEDLR